VRAGASQDDEDVEGEYEVEQVMEYDSERNRYLVKWKGYAEEENSWEHADHLANAPAKRDEFWKKHRKQAPVFEAYRKANRLRSKAMRAGTHSTLVDQVPDDYFYPSDNTDGNED
jgi:hypothetical protein